MSHWFQFTYFWKSVSVKAVIAHLFSTRRERASWRAIEVFKFQPAGVRVCRYIKDVLTLCERFL